MRIGIYQVYWGPVGGGQRFIGKVAEVLSQYHHVEIIHHSDGFDRVGAEEAMDLDLSRVSFRHTPPIVRPDWPTRNPLVRLRLERDFRAEISRPYDLFIDSSDIPPLFCHAPRGVLLVHFPLLSFEDFHGHTNNSWRQHPAPIRWASNLWHWQEWRQRLRSYDLSLTNSGFTQRWLKRLWGLDAEIVNPPLRDGFSPQAKSPLIVSIGAFRSGQHKKHGMTIDVFKELYDRGLRGWRYVLIGACGAIPRDCAYLESLRQRAEGYPIEFRADVSGVDLKNLLERSALFWHSMGYGVDEEKDPRLLEHFGMVAVEAMAAGSVPIVFNGGGLREIVDHGRTGILWSTAEELAEQTLAIIRDDSLQKIVRENAVAEAKRYSTSAFAARLFEVLDPVLQ